MDGSRMDRRHFISTAVGGALAATVVTNAREIAAEDFFQGMFAIITPALIVGAYVERIGFGFVLLFSGLWMLLCYAPVVHWIWGGGMMADGGIFGETGVRDFAGGIVVHETAGIAASAKTNFHVKALCRFDQIPATTLPVQKKIGLSS